MFVRRFIAGELYTNCYLVACEKTKKAMVIDPGYKEASELILKTIRENDFILEFLINTHGHSDHIGGNKTIQSATSAKILIHELDSEMLLNPEKNLSFFLGKKIYSPPADRHVKDGEKIRIGSLDLKVIHTPGHSPGSICLETENSIFTGDTLFAQGIGRTDLPGGSFRDIKTSIREKLFQIDESKIIYPGHGNYSTIGEEKRNQAFF